MLAASLASCGNRDTATTEDFTRWVDQRIGTGGHGHVFMGANVPFGMVQLGPTSIPQSWDWTSGYHISDTTVIGFSHTHLSGTGIGDLSDIVLMPVTGAVKHSRGTADNRESGMWSTFSHSSERYAPGYYATRLDRYGVDVELTATARVGFHKYTFPATTADARIVVDLENGTCWDAPVETYLRVADDRTVEGYRFSKGWASDQRVYFVARFSRPFTAMQIYDGDMPVDGTESTSPRLYAEALFGEAGPEPLFAKVALSPVSIEGARKNMQAELPGWDFEATVSEARAAWNSELSKIRIETADRSVKRIFYTALYHTMIVPSLFCDVDGTNPVSGGERAGNTYTTFSLWDTYRAAHPLATIIHPEKVPDMIGSMIDIYRRDGKLPVWHLWGNETDCMVGNPAIPVVADAVLKDFEGFDHAQAYDAMKASAMLDERGMNLLKQYGYIPSDLYNESVATCMEYALADWSVARVAEKSGDEHGRCYFDARSRSWRRYFDAQTGFVRGRLSDGSWRTPFDPVASTHRADDYTEGNAWQYTWLAPHDVEGLVELFGGQEAFVAKLDSLFTADSVLGEGASPDISGLIGQYAHGNEPGHHTLYLYTMVGEPWKTADLVRRVLGEMYLDGPDGLSGNEDAGQMSAWYILSSLGFYQVEPAGGRFFFGSPILDKAVINVGGGRTFTVKTLGASSENCRIQSIVLNGEKYEKPYIDFADISRGGEIVFTMGPKPTVWYR